MGNTTYKLGVRKNLASHLGESSFVHADIHIHEEINEEDFEKLIRQFRQEAEPLIKRKPVEPKEYHGQGSDAKSETKRESITPEERKIQGVLSQAIINYELRAILRILNCLSDQVWTKEPLKWPENLSKKDPGNSDS